MEHNIARLVRDCEHGRISRRQLLQTLGVSATAALVAGVVPKTAAARVAQPPVAGRVFPVTTINHLSYAASDYGKVRDFYVDLFGMRVAWDDGKGCALEFGSLRSPNGMFLRNIGKPGDKPTINHIAYGIPNFMSHKAAMKAEIDRRGLQNVRPDTEVGWTCDDPGGYMLNIVPEKDNAMFPGAAAPCDVAASAKCQEAHAAGLKNLSAAPKPGGKGFKAYAYSHVVLNVPDIQKEMEFYRDMFGMKVIYYKPEENPDCFLRFGQNTLFLRNTSKPGEKPYCNHFGFAIENYDQAKVKAELERRGLNPKPDSRLAWTVQDPDGFEIEAAGSGLAEHLANECHGSAVKNAQTGIGGCPGGPDT